MKCSRWDTLIIFFIAIVSLNTTYAYRKQYLQILYFKFQNKNYI